MRVDRLFRVFHNARYPYIDVKQPQEDLTELVEVDDERPFILHPGEFVLGSTLERIRLPDDLVARLEGKALALDTRSDDEGWTDHGRASPGRPRLRRGRLPHGRPGGHRVDARTSVSRGRVLGRHHGRVRCRPPVANDRQERPPIRAEPRPRASRPAQIERTLMVRGERNHQMPLAGAVWYPTRDLPIDPYVLGAWIGDGTTTKAEITCADAEILERGRRRPATRSRRSARAVSHTGSAGQATRATRSTGRYERNDSLSSALRNLGLLGRQAHPGRVPAARRSSSARRCSQGLMDTDGYVDKLGRCDLTTVREPLAHQFCELVASLGFRPTLARKRASLRRRRLRPEVRSAVHGRPTRVPPRRASSRVRRSTARFHRFRAIAEVREVPSVPVRCIQVVVAELDSFSSRGSFIADAQQQPWAASACSSTRPPASSTPAGTGTSRSSCRTSLNLPITIYYGMKIGQLSFVQMTEPAAAPYGSGALGSKYQGQRGPTPSRYWKNFD